MIKICFVYGIPRLYSLNTHTYHTKYVSKLKNVSKSEISYQ